MQSSSVNSTTESTPSKEIISGHLEDLRHSGLNDAIIELMGVHSVISKEVPGFAENGLWTKVNTALEIPYPNVEGFSRYKLFPPMESEGGTMKYYQPAGTGNHLYILPPVADVVNDVRVPLFFVEGEKKAAAAVQHGLKAIGFSGIWNWKERDTWAGIEDLKALPLADRSITIVPDSDTWFRDDLQRAIYAFSKYLESRGAKVLVVVLPQSSADKVGLDDYLFTHSLDDLQHEKWIPTKHPTLKQHKEWYEDWKKGKNEAAKVKSLFLADDEPYEQIVDTAQLLDLLTAFVRRYVAVQLDAAHGIALWILHAWALDAFDISPYLYLTSPAMRCGKTTLLDVVRNLTPRAVAASNITGPAVFRVIEEYTPTLIIDEADSFFGEKNEELRGILNAGHRRSTAFVVRTMKTASDNHEVKLFSVWAPKAIAAIGKIANTLQDRSITVHMKRKAPGEKVERFRSAEVAAIAKPLRSMAARWKADNVESLGHSRPTTPDVLNDRARDNWDPLAAVAELAGGAWPERMKRAALVLSGDGVTDEADGYAFIDLLRELKEIFKAQDRISSTDLVEQLTKDPDGRWVEWYRGRPITQRQVARLLEPLNVKPRTIRIGDSKTLKGYFAEWFDDAFNRYLVQEPGFDPSHASQANDSADLEGKNGPSHDPDVTERKSDVTVQNSSVVTDVTDKKGFSGRNGLDEDGFDWANGVQHDPQVIEAEWARIKADHARRARGE